MITPDDLQNVISEIERSGLQQIKRGAEIRTFELKANPALLSNLSGNCGAFIVRSLLHELKINEHHVFKWRLENKFRQYQVLDYYLPGCMPQTLSFSGLLNPSNGVEQIKALFSQGFFLKETLGDASFSKNNWDKTAKFDLISKLPNNRSDGYESYMLQKKLDIKCEFRVHTFCKEIIPGLIYVIQGHMPPDRRTGAERFVNEVLQKLPDVILQGTFIAWDIALTNDDQYYIIEANFTGFHPEYRAGFQTTGYVDDHHFGPIICAWLNHYFNEKFGIYIDAVEDSLLSDHQFYRTFLFYRSLFNAGILNIVRDTTKDESVLAIIYLGEDSNESIVRLINHFLLVDYAEMYYVIVKDEYLLKARDLFSGAHKITVWVESELFTKDQYELVEQFNDDRRRQICCYHSVRKVQNGAYLVI